jgi:hypothetical protein
MFPKYRAAVVATIAVAAIFILFYFQADFIWTAAASLFLIAGGLALDNHAPHTVSGGGIFSWFGHLFGSSDAPSTTYPAYHPAHHIPVACPALDGAGKRAKIATAITALAKLNNGHCNTAEHYRDMRAEFARHFPESDCFRDAMTVPNPKNAKNVPDDTGIFVGDKITTGVAPFVIFARVGSGVMTVPYPDCIREGNYSESWKRDFFLARNLPNNDTDWGLAEKAATASMSRYHRFLILRDLHWKTFNALTFDKDFLHTLEAMRECAIACAISEIKSQHPDEPEPQESDIGLYFHCWPHNSVQALHMHIIDKRFTDKLPDWYVVPVGHADHAPAWRHHKHKNLPYEAVVEVLKSE